MVSEKRDLAATRRFFTRALEHGPRPAEVTTDRASAYPRVLDELLPAACHVVDQYANNTIEADHGRLKSRLRPMRGLKRLRSARVISAARRQRGSLPEIGAGKLCPLELGAGQVRPPESSGGQVRPVKPGTSETDTFQVSSTCTKPMREPTQNGDCGLDIGRSLRLRFAGG